MMHVGKEKSWIHEEEKPINYLDQEEKSDDQSLQIDDNDEDE